MRIIKDSTTTDNTTDHTTDHTTDNNYNPIETIVGEMLNIETSTLHYINGSPIGAHPEYNGYPRIVHPHCYDAIRAVAGYIFIPSDLPIDKFEAKLMDTIQIMERSMTKPNGEKVLVLKNYHSVRVAYGTNIKIQSSNERTVSQAINGEGKRFRHNIKRVFAQSVLSGNIARFTWYIMAVNTAIVPIKPSNILDSISRYVSSIFYDKHDICALGHNEITFDFSRSCLKNYTNTIEMGLNLMEYGNPIAAELSPLWIGKPNITLRTIKKPIYRLNYDALELQYVNTHLQPGSNIDPEPYSVCAKCMATLWGDNYVLTGVTFNANGCIVSGTATCIALCPLCLQFSGNTKISHIEKYCTALFRVTYPLTCEGAVKALGAKHIYNSIYNECLQFTKKHSIVMRNGSPITVFLIGTKYVLFDNASDYLYGDTDDVKLIDGRIALVKPLSIN